MACNNHTQDSIVDRNYFFDDPPVWPFVVFWTIAPLFALATWYISIKNILDHRVMAKKAGMDNSISLYDPFSSFGIRCDLTVEVLSLPMIYSLTGVLDVFRPELGDFMAFIRVVWFSKAILRIIRLFYVRGGGLEVLTETARALPPMKPKAPPFCCIFGWPCCARKVTMRPACHPWSVPFLLRGVYAYTVLGPLTAMLNIVLKNLAVTTEGRDNRIQYMTVITAVYSAFSVWCFRNLSDFTGPGIEKQLKKRGDNSFNPREAHFVTLHYLMGHLVELVLTLALRSHDNGNWCMPQATLAIMCNGFITCILELFLALQAIKLFPHNAGSYPPLEHLDEKRHKGLPLDVVVLLQINGIPATRWEVFHLEDEPLLPEVMGKIASPVAQGMGDGENTASDRIADQAGSTAGFELKVGGNVDAI